MDEHVASFAKELHKNQNWPLGEKHTMPLRNDGHHIERTLM